MAPNMDPWLSTNSRDMDYAGFWVRAVAAVIDVFSLWVAELAVVAAIWAIGLLPLDEPKVGEGLGAVMLVWFFVFPAWPYFTICESSKAQATAGKRLLGLRVTDVDGDRIGFGRANKRYWYKLLSYAILFMGFVMIAYSSRKQGLHDLIAETLVVRVRV